MTCFPVCHFSSILLSDVEFPLKAPYHLILRVGGTYQMILYFATLITTICAKIQSTKAPFRKGQGAILWKHLDRALPALLTVGNRCIVYHHLFSWGNFMCSAEITCREGSESANSSDTKKGRVLLLNCEHMDV